MRTDHLLMSPRPAGYPTQVVFLDVDTDRSPTGESGKVVSNSLYCWRAISIRGEKGVYGGPKEHGGMTVESFWEEFTPRLVRSGQITAISSRALLTWGVLGLWGRLTARSLELVANPVRRCYDGATKRKGPPPGACVCDGLPTIIDFRVPRAPGKCRVLDVRNWGVDDLPETRTAAGRVDFCYHFYLQMVARSREHNLAGLKPTSAAQAYHSWRAAHKRHEVMCHADERAMRVECEAYYSGRAECFRLGLVHGPVYHLDVSSQYRSIYATMSLPTVLCRVEKDIEGSAIADIASEYGVIADVTVRTEEPAYPVRVNHPRRDDRFPTRLVRPEPWRGQPVTSLTIYPVGTFRTALAGPELIDAMERGRIVHWHWLAWYDMAPALADYAECMSSLLTEGAPPPALRRWAKSLAVCVVGKLGQRDSRWEDAEWPHFHRPWHHWIEPVSDNEYREWRSLAWRTQMREGEGWAHDACPSMAAYITSAARMQLMRAIRICGRAHVHYCATDSIWVDEYGYEEMGAAGLIGDGAPGMWRLEGVHKTMELKGIGHYVVDGVVTCAGMPGSGGAVVPQLRPALVTPSVTSACRAGHQPLAVEAIRSYGGSGQYWHGVRLADGRLAPHVMEE